MLVPKRSVSIRRLANLRTSRSRVRLAKLRSASDLESDSQIPRVSLQSRTDAGPEAIGIDQKIGELTDFEIAGAACEIAQRFRSGIGFANTARESSEPDRCWSRSDRYRSEDWRTYGLRDRGCGLRNCAALPIWNRIRKYRA